METCANCGMPTDKLHPLKNGVLRDRLPDAKVCWQCYVNLHVKEYEANAVCPTCNSSVKWAGAMDNWADFTCAQGHKINVNFLKECGASDWQVFRYFPPIVRGDDKPQWFLHNEKTGEDHPTLFDHKPTPEEVRQATAETYPIEVYVPDRFQTVKLDGDEDEADECPHGVPEDLASEADECAECSERDEEAICTYWQPDAFVTENGKTLPIVKRTPSKVQEGVPQGFFANSYLIEINKGFLNVDQQNAGIKQTLPCWNEGCDKPLEICGYPFYICDNAHAFNVKTGERWLWKGYDETYHGILDVLQDRIQPAYQKLFFPSSLKREDTEASRLSSHLSGVGNYLYDLLGIETPDPYHWGRDEHRHFAGLRFAIHMMQNAIKEGKRVVLPSESAYEGSQTYTDLRDVYLYDAKMFAEQLGSNLEAMLTSIENVKRELPKKPTQTKLI